MDETAIVKSPESVTKWETAHFGGFRRMIIDHPRIRVDDSIGITPASDNNYLTFWEKDKVLKMFLSRANSGSVTTSRSTVNKLLVGARTERVKTFFGDVVLRTVVDEDAVGTVLDILLTRDKELAPLFAHYYEFIKKSSFYYETVEKQSSMLGMSGINFNEEKPEDKEKNEEPTDQKEQDQSGASGRKENNNGTEEKEKDNKSGGDGKQEGVEKPEEKSGSGESKEEKPSEEKKEDGNGKASE
jgi:hypothetical protein